MCWNKKFFLNSVKWFSVFFNNELINFMISMILRELFLLLSFMGDRYWSMLFFVIVDIYGRDMYLVWVVLRKDYVCILVMIVKMVKGKRNLLKKKK